MARIARIPKFNKLFQINSNGKIKEWDISIVVNKFNFPEIIKVYGLQNSKKVTVNKVIKYGKNIGKANETTCLEQAILEANSEYLKKKDSGYSENLNVKSVLPKLPMLATKFIEREHDIKYSCFIQPKLDGIRCTLVKGKLYSRKNKEFNFMGHILELYKDLADNIVLDGELYSESITFQQIVSIVKQKNNAPPKEISEKIKFCIFDMYDNSNLDLDFVDRLALLKKIVKPGNLVDTKLIKNKNELERYYHAFLDKKYEGIMVRNAIGKYEFNKRSKNLQKLKPFEDSEFEIIGFTQGTGVESGCVIWECKTKKNKTFMVRPKGTHSERKQLYKIGKQFIGKWITIKFQEYTNDGIPRFPTTLQNTVSGYIRDYE